MHTLTRRADKLQPKTIATKVNAFQEEAIRTTYKAFSNCCTDRNADLSKSKKVGMYHVSNLLIRAYFYLDSKNLCMNVIRAVEVNSGGINFPKNDLVEFGFYKGVLLFGDEK